MHSWRCALTMVQAKALVVSHVIFKGKAVVVPVLVECLLQHLHCLPHTRPLGAAFGRHPRQPCQSQEVGEGIDHGCKATANCFQLL